MTIIKIGEIMTFETNGSDYDVNGARDVLDFGNEDYVCPHCIDFEGFHGNPDCPDRPIIEGLVREFI